MAFSHAHLRNLVSGIVDDCLGFTDILGKHANAQNILKLEEAGYHWEGHTVNGALLL